MAGEEKQRANGALWLTKSKSGVSYLNGNLELECEHCQQTARYWLRVFKNTQKQTGEKTPDYRVFCTEETPR